MKTVIFLLDVIELFQHLRIGERGKTAWKPIQTGVLLGTTAVLEIQEYYLNVRGFSFVLLSRFGQDSLENLFSTLRSKNRVPKPLEFRCALRAATMAQFFKPSSSGSYSNDIGFSLSGLESFSTGSQVQHGPEIVFSEGLLHLNESEQESFDYLAGYVVSSVRKNMTVCSQCVEAITCEEASILTKLKSYTNNNKLTLPSRTVILFLQTAENLFRANTESLLHNRLPLSQLEEAVYKSATTVNCFPACHKIDRKLLRVFLKTRVHILLRKENERAAQSTNLKCGSRSIGKQVATTNVK